MKKILMTIAAVLCCAFVSEVNAQENRNQRVLVGVNQMNYPKKQRKDAGAVLGAIADALLTGQVTTQKENYESAVRSAIVKGISQARRVSAIDGQLSAEEIANKKSYYVDATVSNISTTTKNQESPDKKKIYTYYKGLVSVTLHIKNAKTDEVVASPTFNVSEMDVSWMETADEALNKAILRLSNYITTYFNQWFPLYANIIEGAREKKDKQKEVYIDLGSREGAYKGIHLAVYTIKTIAGKEAKKQIGKLKSESVEGADISLCKVQSGGKDIKAAIDEGLTLQVRTTD